MCLFLWLPSRFSLDFSAVWKKCIGVCIFWYLSYLGLSELFVSVVWYILLFLEDSAILSSNVSSAISLSWNSKYTFIRLVLPYNTWTLFCVFFTLFSLCILVWVISIIQLQVHAFQVHVVSSVLMGFWRYFSSLLLCFLLAFPFDIHSFYLYWNFLYDHSCYLLFPLDSSIYMINILKLCQIPLIVPTLRLSLSLILLTLLSWQWVVFLMCLIIFYPMVGILYRTVEIKIVMTQVSMFLLLLNQSCGVLNQSVVDLVLGFLVVPSVHHWFQFPLVLPYT